MISTPRSQTLEQIKVLLRRDLKLGDTPIADDMPFFGTDVDLDSLDILLLMTSIEKQFKVKIPSEAVGKQVFQNVSTLAAYVDEQIGGATGAGSAAVAATPTGDLLARLPHQDPFRFVSRLVSVQPGDAGEGIWEVTGKEAFFTGHFPGMPLVPGVLIAEAMAQLSGIVGPDNGSGGKLAHVDIRFEQAVAPPAQITLKSKLSRTMGDLQMFEVSAEVGGSSVARGTLALSRPRARKITSCGIAATGFIGNKRWKVEVPTRRGTWPPGDVDFCNGAIATPPRILDALRRSGAARRRRLPARTNHSAPLAPAWRHLFHALMALLLTSAFAVGVKAAPATSQPTSAPSVDPALWQKMADIDARASKISSLLADFEQKKYTALLRKPLISSGKVRVKGATMRWDTEKPEPTVMLVSDKDVKLYYPAQKSVEVYSLDQRLAELVASPLPRLAVLKDRFSFSQIATTELDKAADPAKFLALRLTPIQDDLRQHVQEVRVLLEVSAGYIVQAELIDADGDRTVIHFNNVAANADVGDLELKLPAGTKISKPLEGLPAGSR